MIKSVHGRVHGKHIELDEDLGIPDGQEVELTVRATDREQSQEECIGRWAGIAPEDEAEFNEIFAQLERERKSAMYREQCE